MKLIFVMLAVISTSYCKPQVKTESIPIIKYDNQGVNQDGSYKFAYETGNEITAEETGYLKNPGNNKTEAIEKTGRFSFIAPDGTRYEITYVANENGFQPTGQHLPTPPPIPEQLRRAMKFARSLKLPAEV